MKNRYIYLMCATSLLSLSACNDFLEVSSPSEVDADFVFSNSASTRSAMDGAYETWRDCAQNAIFGDGLYYAADIPGSDIERHPEAFSNQQGRHYPECLYQNGNYAGSYGLLSYLKEDGYYAKLYAVISKANVVINKMESTSDFDDIVTNATTPTALSQLYGEAVAMRATAYRELIKNFGDVPYNDTFGAQAGGLVSRDSIYDVCLEQLQKVEPLMYEIGSIPGISAAVKNYFSRTYVKGLIGRMALEAGGYQTRRTDLGADFYKNGKGEVVTLEKFAGSVDHNQATYARRSDWQDLYRIAQKYYKAGIEASGSAQLLTVDPRKSDSGREYNNPYQYFFAETHDTHENKYATESVYEYAMQQGGGNDSRPYAFGRVSGGGNKSAYPCKSYGQGRINPAFYYGLFDPNDKRRDVSVSVTGSSGSGTEALIPFTPGSTVKGGGLTFNKWDENRQTNPWVAAARKSGINGPYMRMSEFYLGYAEACAALGETGPAMQYLKIIRERSFPDGKANTDAFVTSCGSLLRAIIEERGFEYAGEGDRRFTLIRTGFFPEAIKRVKELTRKMIDGLKNDGYYTFDNGNTISSYVWTKLVDAKTIYGHRLTAQCPEGKEDDPVLYPGWRGQKDDWESQGMDYKTTTPKTNLAIKGLFKHIEPDSEEAQALEADGYAKQDWGNKIVDNDDEYYKYLFYDYDYVSAPIYLWPFTPNIVKAGGFSNGYGFKQE